MAGLANLSVIVHRARKLLVKGKGSNDAYATMEFQGAKYATNVVEKSCDPAWHQECQFKLPAGKCLDKLTVTVCIYNKHHGKLGLQSDDFIGVIYIPLSSLDSSQTKEQRRWYELEHKNPKKEKKNRGEVDVGFKFTIAEKSPKPLKKSISKVGSKARRRLEDEDSGLGVDNFPMRRGVSLSNLQRTPSSASDGVASKKRQSVITLGSAASARGLAKISNKIGLSGNRGKSTSIEVLNSSGIVKASSSFNLKWPNSSESTTNVGKKHVRNRSMPASSLLSLTDRNTSYSSVCINGPHIYISEADSGNNSLTTSSENLSHNARKAESEFSSLENLHASHNVNCSNSKERRLSLGDVTKSSHSIVYKPKSSYRLDVKDLVKVSPIPEDPAVTFQHLDKEELLRLCVNQHNAIAKKNKQIRELEDYIDTLLVRVMVATPHILDRSRFSKETKF